MILRDLFSKKAMLPSQEPARDPLETLKAFSRISKIAKRWLNQRCSAIFCDRSIGFDLLAISYNDDSQEPNLTLRFLWSPSSGTELDVIADVLKVDRLELLGTPFRGAVGLRSQVVTSL